MVGRCTYCGQREDTDTPCALCPDKAGGPKSTSGGEQNQSLADREGTNSGTDNLNSNSFDYTELSTGEEKEQENADDFNLKVFPHILDSHCKAPGFNVSMTSDPSVSGREDYEMECDYEKEKRPPLPIFKKRFGYSSLCRPEGLTSGIAMEISEELKAWIPATKPPQLSENDYTITSAEYVRLKDNDEDDLLNVESVNELPPPTHLLNLQGEIEGCLRRIQQCNKLYEQRGGIRRLDPGHFEITIKKL